MRFTAASRRPDPIIDVSPMIDVVFQLVLFFMVSTTFVTSPGIQVDLPRSSAQTVLTEDKDIQVWMTTDGAVFVNDEPVNTNQLHRIFLDAAKANPNTMVIIKADTGVTHGRVVLVMDAAKAVGLSRLAIATDAGTGTDDEP